MGGNRVQVLNISFSVGFQWGIGSSNLFSDSTSDFKVFISPLLMDLGLDLEISISCCGWYYRKMVTCQFLGLSTLASFSEVEIEIVGKITVSKLFTWSCVLSGNNLHIIGKE